MTFNKQATALKSETFCASFEFTERKYPLRETLIFAFDFFLFTKNRGKTVVLTAGCTSEASENKRVTHRDSDGSSGKGGGKRAEYFDFPKVVKTEKLGQTSSVSHTGKKG